MKMRSCISTIQTIFFLILLNASSSCTSRKGDILSILTADEPPARRVIETFKDVCSRNIGGEEADQLKDTRQQLCSCLSDAKSRLSSEQANAICAENGDLQKWYRSIYSTFSTQWPLEYVSLGPTERTCLENLTILNIDTFYAHLLFACQDNPKADLRRLIAAPSESDQESCWLYTKMSADGCIIAQPCDASGANLRDLPVAPTDANTNHRMKGSVKLCNANLQALNHKKDPEGSNQPFNQSFLQELSLNRISPPGSYGATNCHGSAQYIGGDFLSTMQVTEISYQRLYDEPKCKILAKAKLESVAQPTIASLALDPGGLIVNMRHEACDDCGKVKLEVEGCDAVNLQAHAVVDKMCVGCWTKKIEENGFKKLAEDSSWQDLYPGCMLSQDDHSIVIVGRNRGLCYHYESTTPYGPPQLRVLPCPRTWASFPLRWCPTKPLVFDWTN